MSKKIAIVLHNLKGGGAEKMMARLSTGFYQSGCDVTVLLIEGAGVNIEFIDENVKVVNLNASRTLTSILKLRDYLSNNNFEIIISALTHVNVALLLSSLGSRYRDKIYVSERNYFSLDKKVNNSPIIRFAYFIAPFLYWLNKKPVIGVSSGVADDLVKNSVFFRINTSVGYNPVLDNDYSSRVYQQSEHVFLRPVRDHKTIISAGRLADQKSFDILIKAFSMLSDTKTKLIIFGEGPLRGELEKLITSLCLTDRVSLPGYSTNLLAEMNSADLFVLSSSFEGSPNVLVEALSVGVPVVSTNCPSGPSEILDNGDIAPLVKVGDIEELHLAIKNQLSYNKSNNEILRINAVKRFTVENSVSNFKKIIDRF